MRAAADSCSRGVAVRAAHAFATTNGGIEEIERAICTLVHLAAPQGTVDMHPPVNLVVCVCMRGR